MLRTWFAAVVRYITSLSLELLWADALGPFIDDRIIYHQHDEETPEEEAARLEAMLRFTMFM
jgi:hypothetical protein